ncbi:MAG: hypothetical protein DRQ55_06800 [Planctomycetota bacterium]|nr:MAG: hypothetical protein DRQ55_06800 [Planctomycetota bacterium]
MLLLAWAGPWLPVALAAPVPVPAQEQPPAIVNGDFELEPGGADPVPGWSVQVEQADGALPPSEVRVSSKDRRTGRRCLQLRGDFGTAAWQSVKQELSVRPGGTYRLSAWTKTLGVVREGMQLEGCSLTLTLFDAEDAVITRRVILPKRPRERWTQYHSEVLAPTSTRRVLLSVSLSMSGELWVDDVALSIDGGWELPAPELLFTERFEGGAMSPEWEPLFVGEGRPSQARPERLADGRYAVVFVADEDTERFVAMSRELAVAPQDTLYLSARTRAEVPGDGQVELQLSLRFLDSAGEPVGPRRVDSQPPGPGWNDTGLIAVAPEGAATARVSIGLYGAGQAWVTDMHLLAERGSAPPYAGWLERVGSYVIVHLPPEHREARHLMTLVRELDRAAIAARRAAEAEAGDAADSSGKPTPPLHVWFYLDDVSCEALSGLQAPSLNVHDRVAHVLDARQASQLVTQLYGG